MSTIFTSLNAPSATVALGAREPNRMQRASKTCATCVETCCEIGRNVRRKGALGYLDGALASARGRLLQDWPQ